LTWITTIPVDKATGDLKRAYEMVLRTRGKISNIMSAQSLNPTAMRVFLELYNSLVFGKSGLSRGERETIATIVSAHNHCSYCTMHHGEALRFHLKDDDQLAALKERSLPDSLPERTKALVDYALKLTLKPSEILQEDLGPLRRNGLNDSEILDAVLLISYMNFVNRVATGLGVQHDEQEAKGYKY